MSNHYEPQVGRNPDGTFWMTITLSNDRNTHTTGRTVIEAASMEEAIQKARQETAAFKRLLEDRP